MDLPDPACEFVGWEPLPPDRPGLADPRRDEAQSAASPGRWDERGRWRCRRNHDRVDFALVAVEVDFRAGLPCDDRHCAGCDRAPDELVDKPVLQQFQRGAGKA